MPSCYKRSMTSPVSLEIRMTWKSNFVSKRWWCRLTFRTEFETKSEHLFSLHWRWRKSSIEKTISMLLKGIPMLVKMSLGIFSVKSEHHHHHPAASSKQHKLHNNPRHSATTFNVLCMKAALRLNPPLIKTPLLLRFIFPAFKNFKWPIFQYRM